MRCNINKRRDDIYELRNGTDALTLLHDFGKGERRKEGRKERKDFIWRVSHASLRAGTGAGCTV